MSPRRLTVLALGALASCAAVSPPPLVPMHGGTAPHGEGETTVTVVLGVAGEILGGDGVGVALRVERQVDDGLAVGGQVGGGRGKEGRDLDDAGPARRHLLLEARGYGRLTSADHDWVSALGSIGVSTMDTGLFAATIAVGGAVSFPNRHAVPALGVFAALSVPLRAGDPVGNEGKRPRTTRWLGASVGLGVPIGDTGNLPSVELGLAQGTGGDERTGQLSLSVADGHSF